MNPLNDFFNNIGDYRKFVPGISANLEFDELSSSAIAAKKQISNVISKEIWDLIKSNEDVNGVEIEAKTYLKSAFGNLTMHKAVIFDVLSKRMAGSGEIYKHELETMRRQYIDNYFNAMDSLISELTTNATFKETWLATPDAKLLDELQVKTTHEFNSFYGIDMSYLFFWRTISVQNEILLEGISELFVKVKDSELHTRKLKLALVKWIVAVALQRFDIVELPPTIRNLFDEQKASRSGSDEQNRILQLAGNLLNDAKSIIQSVEISLTTPDTSDIVSDTSLNNESDKFYFIP